ncbi:sensor histidine kinase [Streptomyces sp. MCA2]|uniref:sensor histidine kinase n=1 Tax=Streptomyces sp. MCA2 TaxID=2944805 RepID=UPI002020043C|nr:sensor histidine kinase [Streptomyces sp. MCA2]MCL7490330.1 sensor histidine kinase [Streptomyces sp. MCA2]
MPRSRHIGPDGDQEPVDIEPDADQESVDVGPDDDHESVDIGPDDDHESVDIDSAEPPWTRNDALVTGGACALNLLSYAFFNDPDGRHHVSVAGFLLVALAAMPLLARRSHPVAALAAALALDATAALTVPLPSHFGAVLVVALYSVARACPGRVTAVAAAATVSLTLLSQSNGRIPPWQETITPPLTTLIVVGTALAINRWQQEVAANRRLLADRAVADERRRIARELHDIVAHHITTMQLMAGGARANLAQPEVVRDALVTLESSGRLALREMRQLLDVLRGDDEPEAAPSLPQPGVDGLDRLVAESRLAGLPTEFSVRGPQRPLPPTVGLTVFRIAQEALTNTRKYAGDAGDARASLQLTYHQDRVVIEVRDDGGGTPPQEGTSAAGSGGYGLIGMRERVALHGGTLTVGPQTDGGFAVRAELPLTTDETAEATVQHEGARR